MLPLKCTAQGVNGTTCTLPTDVSVPIGTPAATMNVVPLPWDGSYY